MTENGDTDQAIQRMGQLKIPADLIRSVDFAALAQRVKDCCARLDEAGLKVQQVADAGFLRKMLWGFTGRTTETLADAIQIQGHMAKDQIALLLLNTLFAKELNRQQGVMADQQSRIVAQNEAIEAQNHELKGLSEKSLQQQHTIMELHKLTDEQEESIRGLLARAKQIEELEREYAAKFAAAHEETAKALDGIATEIRGQGHRLASQETTTATLKRQAEQQNAALDRRCSELTDGIRRLDGVDQGLSGRVGALATEVDGTARSLEQLAASSRERFDDGRAAVEGVAGKVTTLDGGLAVQGGRLDKVEQTMQVCQHRIRIMGYLLGASATVAVVSLALALWALLR